MPVPLPKSALGRCLLSCVAGFLALPVLSPAASVYSTVSSNDTFVTNGTLSGADATKNYGGAGALVVAGSASGNGEFQTLLRFDLAPAKLQFDLDFGIGNWTLSSITLRLAGNFGVAGAQPNGPIFPVIAGGGFAVDWLANETWVEGTGNLSNSTTDGVVFNDIPSLLGGSEALGNFTYAPPGNNVQLTWTLGQPSGFVTDISSGNLVGLRLYATSDNTSYLFNARTFGTTGNRPLLSVTAVPEPGTAITIGIGVLALAVRRRRNA